MCVIPTTKEQGILVNIGEPESHLMASFPGVVNVRIPITLQTNKSTILDLEEAARSLGGETLVNQTVNIRSDAVSQKIDVLLVRMARDIEVARYFQEKAKSLKFSLDAVLENGEVWSCGHWNGDIWLKELFYSTSDLEQSGIIGWFNEPRIFTVIKVMPMSAAQKIKAIYGEFREVSDRHDGSKSRTCSIESTSR